MPECIDVALQSLSFLAKRSKKASLDHLYVQFMLTEEDGLLRILHQCLLMLLKELLVIHQIIDLSENPAHESAIDLEHKLLNELILRIIEDEIAIVLHLLADVMDDISVDLIQLAELPEATLDDELQAKEQSLGGCGVGEGQEAVD